MNAQPPTAARESFTADCLVVGAGPAGVACAHGLLARGRRVLLVDGGLSLEPERAETVHQLAQLPPDQWPPETVRAIKGGLLADASGVPLKTLFGSDFPYRGTEQWIPWRAEGVGVKPSLAIGGLSNVWGAAMLPYAEADVSDWPFGIKTLADHYRAVAGFTGLSAQVDDLADWLPLPGPADDYSVLRPSQQIRQLLAGLESRRDALRARGWRFGRARVAVRVKNAASHSGCEYCTLCMYGCPYGHIYNSADTVRELQANPNFTYRPGVIVTHVEDAAEGAVARARALPGGATLEFSARQIFLAAGVLPTAQIVLRSRAAYDTAIRLRDSQYFLFPLVTRQGGGDVWQEKAYTLTQAFIELRRPEISRHTVHLQIYSYSDLIGQGLRKSMGPLAGPLAWLARRLDQRTLVVQGFLHSDDSRAIRMELRREGESDRLHLQPEPGIDPSPAIRRLLGELSGQSGALGGWPLSPMLQIAEPGRSIHCGSSFPMRTRPQGWETDLLGRLPGWQNVHLADASVLPSIPATTITFTAMANARRIGWESAS